MNDTPNERAVIGANNPPLYDEDAYTKIETRARDIVDSGAEWLSQPIVDEGEAQLLVDFIAQVKAEHREVETARKDAKRPHTDRATAVDTAFNRIGVPLARLASELGAALTKYTTAKAARLKAEAIERERVAKAAADKAAADLAEAKARGDQFGAHEAEIAAKTAAKEVKAAAKPVSAAVQSAMGGGRTMAPRAYYTAQIDKPNLAFAFLRDHPDHGPKLREFMAGLLEAEHRAKDGQKDIPGVTFLKDERIA